MTVFGEQGSTVGLFRNWVTFRTEVRQWNLGVNAMIEPIWVDEFLDPPEDTSKAPGEAFWHKFGLSGWALVSVLVLTGIALILLCVGCPLIWWHHWKHMPTLKSIKAKQLNQGITKQLSHTNTKQLSRTTTPQLTPQTTPRRLQTDTGSGPRSSPMDKTLTSMLTGPLNAPLPILSGLNSLQPTQPSLPPGTPQSARGKQPTSHPVLATMFSTLTPGAAPPPMAGGPPGPAGMSPRPVLTGSVAGGFANLAAAPRGGPPVGPLGLSGNVPPMSGPGRGGGFSPARVGAAGNSSVPPSPRMAAERLMTDSPRVFAMR